MPPNIQYALYQTPQAHVKPPRMVEGPGAIIEGSGGPCTTTYRTYPHQQYTSAPARMNIDGHVIQEDKCSWRCDDSGRLQINPSPYRSGMVLPGGVLSAPKFFTQCRSCK